MKPSLLSRILFAALSAIAALSLSGCGTVEGFGEDLQTLGRKMENAADNAQSGDSGGRY